MMKVIDKSFEELNTSLDISQILENITATLKNMNIDYKILEKIYQKSENFFIQIIDDGTYSIKLPNGVIKENRIAGTSGALKTNMIFKVDDKELNIIPGVVLRKNYNVYQLVHELLHVLSSRQHDYFDDEGITYTKTGTKIDYYNRALDEFSNEKNFSSDGLNEGITELLASIITKEYTGNYAPYVVISKLFMNNNNYLLNAYFDDNISEFEKFYKDVEEKQSLVTREDFKILTSKCTDYEMISKIIVAGIKYCKSNGQEISDEELNLMINYLDNNLMLDSGSWYDLISENVSKLK